MSSNQPAVELSRGLEILAGTYIPKGIGVDDNGGPLLATIENFSKDVSAPISIDLVASSDSRTDLIDRICKSDFALIDHRLEGRFAGFDSGLDVVEAVRSRKSMVPVFYNSGFSADFRRVSGGLTDGFTDGAAVLDSPSCFFFEKMELTRGKKLGIFVELVRTAAMFYVLNLIRGLLGPDLLRIIGTKQVRREKRFFKNLGPVAKGWTRIAETGGTSYQEEDVPSRLLRNAGVTRKYDRLSQTIIEFDQGQVLSFFSREIIASRQIAPEVLEILQNWKNDES